MQTFTFQFYQKATGEQRATGSVQAANHREAVEKARSGLQGTGWTLLSSTRW